MAESVCCVALSTFPVTELRSFGIKSPKNRVVLPAMSFLHRAPSVVLLVCMAESVCCVALSTFPVTELRSVGIKSPKNRVVLPAMSFLHRALSVVLRWMPSHCNRFSNKTADMSRKGTTREQDDRPTTFKEARTSMKARQRIKWLQQCSHATTRPASPIH